MYINVLNNRTKNSTHYILPSENFCGIGFIVHVHVFNVHRGRTYQVNKSIILFKKFNRFVIKLNRKY